MSRKLRLAYFAHSLRSDWNNGNAHFLRGLMRSMVQLGHEVIIYEPEQEWSIENIRTEDTGEASLRTFLETYSELQVQTYQPQQEFELWCLALDGTEVVIMHEWNPAQLASVLLELRNALAFKLLFHDTHHRASSSPEQLDLLQVRRFDGVIAFGEVLRKLYRERFGMTHVWKLHEGADTSVFFPHPEITRKPEIVWIGNWGDGERSEEIREYLLAPAISLQSTARTMIYGVRYPATGLRSLREAGVVYGGYLANLDAPLAYATATVTIHVPRQQYNQVMTGIPTIRVFEALACGIPLVSAPWRDTESLFRPGDLCWASNTAEMVGALRRLLSEPQAAQEQAAQGLETILTRHTCTHRAYELTAICEEVLA